MKHFFFIRTPVKWSNYIEITKLLTCTDSSVQLYHYKWGCWRSSWNYSKQICGHLLSHEWGLFLMLDSMKLLFLKGSKNPMDPKLTLTAKSFLQLLPSLVWHLISSVIASSRVKVEIKQSISLSPIFFCNIAKMEEAQNRCTQYDFVDVFMVLRCFIPSFDAKWWPMQSFFNGIIYFWKYLPMARLFQQKMLWK